MINTDRRTCYTYRDIAIRIGIGNLNITDYLYLEDLKINYTCTNNGPLFKCLTFEDTNHWSASTFSH